MSVTDMKPSKAHLIGQSLLAFFQILGVLGLLLFILGVEPNPGGGHGGFILAVIAFVAGGIIHAIWRVVDALAKNQASQ